MLIFIKTQRFHKSVTGDSKSGPQKIHLQETIRIGGLAIFLSNVLVYLYLSDEISEIMFGLLISSSFVFFLGLLEDLTKTIKPIYRLYGSFVTGLSFIILLDVKIDDINIQIFNNLLENSFFSFVFTAFCIALLTQAMNIIDGLNGLSIGYAILVLISILLVSIKVEDNLLKILVLFSLGSILGAFILNFPKPYIFLGDGGAYFIGAFLSFYIIMLVTRNDLVSPFYCFLLAFYPVYETIRSFCRRYFKFKSQSFLPDQMHLHSILYIYFHKKNLILNSNSFSSFLLLIFQLVFLILGFHFFDNKFNLIIVIISFIISYELLYFKLAGSVLNKQQFINKEKN